MASTVDDTPPSVPPSGFSFHQSKRKEAWNTLGSESQKSALAPVAPRHSGPLTCIKGSLWGHMPLECSGFSLHTAPAQCLGSWFWRDKHFQRTDIFEDCKDPAGSIYHEHLEVFHRNGVGCKYLCREHSLPQQRVRAGCYYNGRRTSHCVSKLLHYLFCGLHLFPSTCGKHIDQSIPTITSCLLRISTCALEGNVFF